MELGKIGALIGLGALLATLLSSSGPLPSPEPNPVPAPLPTPVSTPLPTPDDTQENEMRVQLQMSPPNGVTLYTRGIPIVASPSIGVGVRKVQQALNELFIESQTLSWFPKRETSNLRSAIIKISARLNRYPPMGIAVGRNIEREKFGNFRVDIENLRGHNLRYY